MAAASTVAAISLALAAASAAAAAYSAYSQGQAAKAQGKYQQAVMNNNQILAQRAAKDARERGKRAEFEQNLKTRQLIARQNTTLAANGVLVNQDSALDITSDTAETGKYEALTIRSNAEREALGYEAQGVNFSAEGQLANMKGNALADAGMWSAGGSLLGGAGSVAGKWYEYNRLGAFGGSSRGTMTGGAGDWYPA